MNYLTIAFYQYTPIEQAEQFTQEHLAFCLELGITGRIIIAPEGINGTISATPQQFQTYQETLAQYNPAFQNIHWKIDQVSQPSFVKIHVRFKPEIVHSGLLHLNPAEKTGQHLQPADFLAMKDREDVLILDVRSKYEHELGHFKNALRLDIDNFREFPQQIHQLQAHKNKKILTYCTGGIKCEKASAFLLENGFEEVYQLHGGIINYGKEVGGQDFLGNCYVFDGRVQIPVNTVNPQVITRCRNCGTTTSRMVNCANPHCNDHFVQCENCGHKQQGTCSTACLLAPQRRLYDPKGYYQKTNPRHESIKLCEK